MKICLFFIKFCFERYIVLVLLVFHIFSHFSRLSPFCLCLFPSWAPLGGPMGGGEFPLPPPLPTLVFVGECKKINLSLNFEELWPHVMGSIICLMPMRVILSRTVQQRSGSSPSPLLENKWKYHNNVNIIEYFSDFSKIFSIFVQNCLRPNIIG